jgi:hypothetical protein
VHATLETARARDAETKGGWIEITQTLHPRFFLAGRGDVQSITYARSDGAEGSAKYQRYEAILGFRLTPDLTFRSGYLTRKGYVVFHWDDQFVASVTWQRKIL